MSRDVTVKNLDPEDLHKLRLLGKKEHNPRQAARKALKAGLEGLAGDDYRAWKAAQDAAGDASEAPAPVEAHHVVEGATFADEAGLDDVEDFTGEATPFSV